MAALFYIIFWFFNQPMIDWSWGWFILALIFSGNEAKTIYKYTRDPNLEGKEVEN